MRPEDRVAGDRKNGDWEFGVRNGYFMSICWAGLIEVYGLHRSKRFSTLKSGDQDGPQAKNLARARLKFLAGSRK